MLKVLTIIIIVVAVFTTIGAVIPDAITGKIDSAITYFVSMQYSLSPFIDVDALMACEQILIGFSISLGLFAIVMWFVKRTSA